MLEGVRILLVEDHAIVRSSLAMLFESHGALIVGEVEDGQSAVVKALELRPDIILMDITLPGIDGIEATRRICSSWPEARVLALTMHSEDIYLVPFLEAGGAGYVRKSAADRDVLDAIKAIRAGETFVGAGGVATLVRQYKLVGSALPPGPEVLSDRERLVLEKIVRGYTSREIGEQLSISPHTVDTYRTRIMEKLGLSNRHELVDYALRNHLIS